MKYGEKPLGGSTEKNKIDTMAFLKKLNYSVSHISGADYLAIPKEKTKKYKIGKIF